MDPVSGAIIAKALDGLALRQTFLAQNIANANTENYSPARVRFEDALAQAARTDIDAISALEPSILTDASRSMRLDLELAAASETALRYAALLEIRSRQTGLGRAAIGGGR